MNPKQTLWRWVEAVARARGRALVRDELVFDWQRDIPPPRATVSLPGEAAGYLRLDHPRLRELEERYARCDARVTTGALWRPGYVTAEDLRSFRGDNAYVWQQRGRNANPLAYALTAYYARANDRHGWLDRWEEDGWFGGQVETVAGRAVSRDLLDAAIELDFLDRHLGLTRAGGLRVVDIGAGYGRLAHRAAAVLPEVNWVCTDAVAISTFICEFYLRCRGAIGPAAVAPLDEIAAELQRRPAEVAINVHSFSECSPAAVDWWLDLLAEARVGHLMIVPNGEEGLRANDGSELGPRLAAHGFRLKVSEPKYLDPAVQRFGVHPGWHFLFERDAR